MRAALDDADEFDDLDRLLDEMDDDPGTDEDMSGWGVFDRESSDDSPEGSRRSRNPRTTPGWKNREPTTSRTCRPSRTSGRTWTRRQRTSTRSKPTSTPRSSASSTATTS
ncbi:hypothetical protein ACFQH6_19845 [Halobacteriaceae archaeon GCM10025711]